MDPDFVDLWEAIRQMQSHVETINRELGEVCTSIEWLEWWVRTEIAGIGLTFITTLINMVLLVRNSKRK